MSLNRACTVFYTLLVVLSCTVVGHIHSKLLGVYWITILTALSTIPILFNYFLKRKINLRIDLFLLLYIIIYITAVIRGIYTFEAYLALIALVICAKCGGKYAFDLYLARKCVEWIAVFATILLIVQVIWHYLLGGHIQLLPVSMLSGSQLDSYPEVLTTGYKAGTTTYRPSSIFLEPSHYVHYILVAFISALFPQKIKVANHKKTVLYTMGIILTISSTGLAMVVALWIFWALTLRDSVRIKGWPRILLVIVLVFGIGFVVLQSNSILGTYIQRILPQNLSDVISMQEGRFWAMRYLNSFNTNEWLFGRGIGTEVSGFYTGYTRIVYRMGLIGFGTYMLYLVRVAWKKEDFSRYICLVYLILLFGAEFDVFRYIIFYLTFASAGQERQRKLGYN